MSWALSRHRQSSWQLGELVTLPGKLSIRALSFREAKHFDRVYFTCKLYNWMDGSQRENVQSLLRQGLPMGSSSTDWVNEYTLLFECFLWPCKPSFSNTSWFYGPIRCLHWPASLSNLGNSLPGRGSLSLLIASHPFLCITTLPFSCLTTATMYLYEMKCIYEECRFIKS